MINHHFVTIPNARDSDHCFEPNGSGGRCGLSEDEHGNDYYSDGGTIFEELRTCYLVRDLDDNWTLHLQYSGVMNAWILEERFVLQSPIDGQSHIFFRKFGL